MFLYNNVVVFFGEGEVILPLLFDSFYWQKLEME